MDFLDDPAEIMALASTLLLLLLTAQRSLTSIPFHDVDEDSCIDNSIAEDFVVPAALDMDRVAVAALHSFRVWNTFSLLEEDLGFWVKPRSTAWFSRFLLNHYDDERWLKMFRFSKPAMMSLSHLLKPTLEKRNTKYRLAIPVLVRLACALFKISQGATLLICSELFAVGRSTVSLMLREVVHAVNVVLRSEISWPTGGSLEETESAFHHLCGLPGVVGAIDGTHIAISKPRNGGADYFYFKSGGFSMNCQAVVASDKRFLDVFVGMPGSTNDSQMLRRSTLYQRALQNSLWDARTSFSGFSPYLLGDGGYPLLPWLMVPHRQHRNQPIAARIFNKKLSRGRSVVENAFALLKQTFRELQGKCELDVCFVPDVVTCCAILHNLLLRQFHSDHDRLLDILQSEGLQEESTDDETAPLEGQQETDEHVGAEVGGQKRTNLGVFMTLQRVVPT